MTQHPDASTLAGEVLQISRLDTSAGPMLAAFSADGLAALDRGDAFASFTEALARRLPGRSLAAGVADDLERQLDEYFDARRERFDVRLDLRGVASFDLSVLLAAREIPYGQTVTYGELAGRLGNPRAARAVGNALSRCPVSVVVPCHRVVRAADGIGGWGPDLDEKRRLLALERGRPTAIGSRDEPGR